MGGLGRPSLYRHISGALSCQERMIRWKYVDAAARVGLREDPTMGKGEGRIQAMTTSNLT